MEKECAGFVPENTLIEVQQKLIASQEENSAVKDKLITLLEERAEIPEFEEAVERFQTNLRMFRARKKVSQIELGLLINIDNGYISKLENGKDQNPSLKIMLRFCRFFRCGLSELLKK